MDASAQRELYSIKVELNNIIQEIEDISVGIRKEFIGIGSEKCANSINVVINQYYQVKRKLNNLDTSKVTEQFENNQA